MKNRSQRLYLPLLGLSALFAAAAVATLVPRAGASWENVLGYKSLCTFAPIATAICALFAGTTCVIRARLFGPRAGVKRSWRAPAIIGILLVAVIAFSIPPYAKAKLDATSGASVAAGK